MLKPPVKAGLRLLVNGTKQPAKVQVSIPAGDELQVSDDVATQLLAARVGLTDAVSDGPAAPTPIETPVDVRAATAAPGRRRPAKD